MKLFVEEKKKKKKKQQQRQQQTAEKDRALFVHLLKQMLLKNQLEFLLNIHPTNC